MQEQFGSPKERDFIAGVEQSMNDVVDRTSKHFEEVVDRVAPRAIGSQKVPNQERFQEAVLNLLDVPDPVEAGHAWVTEKASQYGLMKALEMYADEVLFVVDEVEKQNRTPVDKSSIDVARAREGYRAG